MLFFFLDCSSLKLLSLSQVLRKIPTFPMILVEKVSNKLFKTTEINMMSDIMEISSITNISREASLL